jgi:deoxyribonuclease-4
MLVHKDLLKLVHYNDSLEACGSCLDRHAFMGSGHIGLEGMIAIAELCSSAGVPMLTE